MTNRPVIGINLDWIEKSEYSVRTQYVVRDAYFRAVYNAGGLPVAIPHMTESAEQYMDIIDGIVIPGGDFAFPPDWYVDEASPYPPSPRLENDLTLIEKALEKDKPYLGICAGMQMLGAVHGCKLTKSLKEYNNSDIDHRKDNPPEELCHKVKITEGTLLHSIVGEDEYDINSHHNEGIIEVTDKVKVNAVAPDGVIEGIEIPDRKFALGIEWHPEFELTEQDRNIFSALVKAAK